MRDPLAIDLINGSELLRQWVDDPAATAADLDALAFTDEASWRDERDAVLFIAERYCADVLILRGQNLCW